MRRSIALLAVLLLPGCVGSPGSAVGRNPATESTLAGWRMLSTDAPGEKAKPKPCGFAEARSMAPRSDFGGSDPVGTFYVLYDAGYRPVGHVTARGYGVRYDPSGRIKDKPMGQGPVLDQAAKILRVDAPIHVYSLDGKPKDLP